MKEKIIELLIADRVKFWDGVKIKSPELKDKDVALYEKLDSELADDIIKLFKTK